MMKTSTAKSLRRLLVLAAALLLLTTMAVTASAQTADATDGLVYALNEDGISYTVTGYFGASTEVVIPTEHNGLPVTALAKGVFLDAASSDGSGSMNDAIVMPGDNLTSYVEKVTFLSKSIRIPDSADALAKDIVIRAYSGSSALSYAQKYGRTYEAVPIISSANVELGATITVNYTANFTGTTAQNAMMRFTAGECVATVTGVPSSSDSNYYVFSFHGIGPHMMGDNILAELLVDGVVVHTVSNYSIRQYCLNMLARANAQNIVGYDTTKYELLRTLIADLLQYGADAQIFANYRTDALANQGITGMSEYTSPSTDYASVSISQSTASDKTRMISATVELSDTIRLRFSFAAADASRVTVKIGSDTFGREDFISAKTYDENGLPIYLIYSDDIYATQIETDFDVALYVDGDKCQTLKYSVLNYVYRKQNDANTALAALVKSVHCYGQAAYTFSKYVPISIVDTKYETDDRIVANVSVTNYPYHADPTGQRDSTAILQKALDDVAAQGGGTVYLPAGQYLITNTVYVPEGCLLIGDWQDPDMTATPEYGTILLAKTPVLDEKYLADRTRDPLICLDTNSSVEGLTVYYPDQDINNILKYGYTIYCQTPSCVTISNVTLLNSYRGIGINVHYEQSCELVQVEGVRMTALEMGYEFYRSSEVGNTVDFKMSTDYWANAGMGFACSNAAALRAYCYANTIGMQFNGLDDGHFSGLYLEGLRTAMYLPTGYCGNYFWGVVYDLTIENCMNGVVIEQLNGMGGMALAKATIDADRAAIYSSATQGSLKLCGVTATSGDIVAVGDARIYVDDTTDISSYEIVSATYQKPAAYLYTVPALPYSNTKEDVTALIQSSLDRAAATGGVVYIPAGVYSVYGTLNVPAGVELRGSAPIFMRDSQNGSDGVIGTVLLTYVDNGATITLAKNAGVNGLRVFCALYSPVDARDLLAADAAVTKNQFAIKGLGSGVYAHNVVITTTFNGIDFTNCDNHSIKHAFGAVYRHFILAGGKNGVIEQCLTNQHFLDRQHFLSDTYLNSAYYSGWKTGGEMGPVFRDEVRRAYGVTVYLTDAVNESVSNVFTYGAYVLILCDNSSAELLNVSSDFHGMGPMFDIKNGSDAVAVNVLRSAGESMTCDASSTFKLINRTAISRFNEPNFDSAKGNLDNVTYAVTDKVMINDGSLVVTNTVAHTGAYTKTGGTSLYHTASQSSDQTVTIYKQNFSSSINAASYAGSNAYLHMWVYVEDMTSSIWTGNITLHGTNGSLQWATVSYITHNGWNELWLPMTGTSGVVKSGYFNSLTITDKRNVLVDHSDYYFDDIYLCHATVADDKPMGTTASYAIAPTPERVIPDLPSHIQENGDIVLLSCDSLMTNLARPNQAHVIHDQAFVKEGSGSWKLQKLQNIACPAYIPTTNISDYMNNGYVHLWLYIEDVSSISGGALELSSGGTADTQEISWWLPNYLTQNGWNELWLPLYAPDSSTSTAFDPTKLNYLRIYTISSKQIVYSIYIDDVRIVKGDNVPEVVTFNILTEEESKYLISDHSHVNADTGARFTDNNAYFIYEYDIQNGHIPSCITWQATTSGQLHLLVSTDMVNWETVYRYEGVETDRGLAAAARKYELLPYLNIGEGTDRKIYVKICDAYPSSGFGGAIRTMSSVRLVISYADLSTTVADRQITTVSGSAIHTNTLGALPQGLVEVVNQYMTNYQTLLLDGPLTTFQSNTYFSTMELHTDAVMAYGSSKAQVKKNVEEWAAVSDKYELHLMTIINRTDLSHEYLSADPSRLDQAMTLKNGTKMTHSGTTYYMVPNDEWTEFVWEMVEIALDAAEVKTIVFEEPDLFKDSGYSECFKREWQKYYGEPWQDQTSSPEAMIKSQQLKLHLLEKMMTTLITRIKEKSPDTKVYVATHSTISYNVVKFGGSVGSVSSINRLLAMGLLDGIIGQTWSDTAGVSLMQDGVSFNSRYLAGYLGYASYVDSVGDLDLFTLVDPVGDGIGKSGRTEKWYYQHYENTLVAQLMQPSINRFQVTVWPARSFEGASQDYKVIQQSVIKAQTEVSGKAAVQSAGTPGFSYVLSDSLSYQWNTNTAWAPSSNDSFMGMTLPLISDGIPLTITAMENIKSVDDLKNINVLLLSFDGQKPQSEEVCEIIAEWVRQGGVCLYVGGHDAYDEISGVWWGSTSTPLQSLLNEMGLGITVNEIALGSSANLDWVGSGTQTALEALRCTTDYNSFYSSFTGVSNPILKLNGQTVGFDQAVGAGRMIAISLPSALFTTQTGGTNAMRALAAYACLYTDYDYASTSLMWTKRGNVVAAYSIGEKNVLTGKYVDLFDPQLNIHTHYVLEADSAALLYDITDVAIGSAPRLLFSCGDITSLEETATVTQYSVFGVDHALTADRFLAPEGLYPQSITAYKIADNSVVDTYSAWDAELNSLLVRIYGENEGVRVTIEWGTTPVESYELQKPVGIAGFLVELGMSELEELAMNYKNVITAVTSQSGNVYDDNFLVSNTSLTDAYRYYCDGNREIIWCIDLNKYEDAYVVMQLLQNYKLDISTDGASWTEVQNFITSNGGYRINSSTNAYTFGIDSRVYAPESDKLYIRLSNADVGQAWGGAISYYEIYYNTPDVSETNPANYAPLHSTLAQCDATYASYHKYQVTCNEEENDAEFIFSDTALASDKCRYCDRSGELYLKIDLTTYKNAVVALQISQNYRVQVSDDNFTYVTVQDWLLAGNAWSNDSYKHNEAYLILDSSVYAAGSDAMYIKLSAADTSKGWGTRLASITLYFDFPATDSNGYALMLDSLDLLDMVYASRNKLSVATNNSGADAAFIHSDNAQVNDVCRYCDGTRELVLKFDLTQYKDAVVALQISQNYHVEVKFDNGAYTVIQDWLLAGNEWSNASYTQNEAYLMLDSNALAPNNAGVMYVKLAAADTSKGWGSRLQSLTVYYNGSAK